jgi:hypothetical protein
VVAVTVEIAVNPIGLGFAMIEAEQTVRPDLMFGVLAWVGILCWCLNCEFARNTDPLRVVFASNSDPSDRCVSMLLGPVRPGRVWGYDVGGRDRRCSTRVF